MEQSLFLGWIENPIQLQSCLGNKEPTGRGCVEFKWFESQLMSDSSELRVKLLGCQSIWDSNDLVVNRCVLQMILVVCWFELQVRWFSIDLRFKRLGCQPIWDSNGLVVNRFEIQVNWLSIDLRFNWFGCQSIWDSNELVVSRSEIQMIWLSTDVCFKWFWLSVDLNFKWGGSQLIWDSSDLVVNQFEIQMIWLSIDLRFKWIGCQLIWDSSDLVVSRFEIQMILVVNRFEIQVNWLSIDLRFKWFGCQSIWDSNELVVKWFEIQVIWLSWNLQPFRGFCVGGFKHRRRKTRNPCACHAKRIVSDPLQIHHACRRFYNPHKLLRLPRILQRVEIPAPAMRNTLWISENSRAPGVLTALTSESLLRAGVVQILATWISKSLSKPSHFNDFGFQIALARRRGANFGDLNFKKCSEALSF